MKAYYLISDGDYSSSTANHLHLFLFFSEATQPPSVALEQDLEVLTGTYIVGDISVNLYWLQEDQTFHQIIVGRQNPTQGKH